MKVSGRSQAATQLAAAAALHLWHLSGPENNMLEVHLTQAGMEEKKGPNDCTFIAIRIQTLITQCWNFYLETYVFLLWQTKSELMCFEFFVILFFRVTNSEKSLKGFKSLSWPFLDWKKITWHGEVILHSSGL